MAIALSDLQAEIRSTTRRDNTTAFPTSELNALILESCQEVSKRLLCLKGDSADTLAGDGTTIAAPADMVKSQAAIDAFYLDSVLQDPLTFAEWRAGKMTGYSYRDGTIYIKPSTNNDRSYTLYYSKLHGALSTNLEFEDSLKKAVFWLACQKVYDRFEIFDKAQVVAMKYEREIEINAPAEPIVSRARTTRE